MYRHYIFIMTNYIAEKLQNLKLKNTKIKHTRNTSWPMEKKVEVVAQYLVLGNMKLVAATTGVSHDLIRQWKTQPWWKELEAEIRATQNIELDTKLSKIVERSLEATLDRLENGEHIYNQKTGEILRKPASLRDVARVTSDFLDKKEVLRKATEEKSVVSTETIAEQLKSLALEFSKWAGKKPVNNEIVDVTAKEITKESTEDAVYDQWEARLQEGTGLGKDEETHQSEGQSGT
jgi:transposase-like protein